jgi:hypothetical protein
VIDAVAVRRKLTGIPGVTEEQIFEAIMISMSVRGFF